MLFALIRETVILQNIKKTEYIYQKIFTKLIMYNRTELVTLPVSHPDKISNMAGGSEKLFVALQEEIPCTTKNDWRVLDNYANELHIKGKLVSITLRGCSQYR